jgi:prepilin-type N-terminal cleavage/methylation domain-containing protein
MLKLLKNNEAGFTLVEAMIVMAISASLLGVALLGQRGLRSRAQFDAAVNKFVATVSDAHNQATAGVNIVGSGDGTSACPSGPAGKYAFIGIDWKADGSLPAGPIEYGYYKAGPVTVAGLAAGATACKFEPQGASVPAPIIIGGNGDQVLFVRNNNGGLTICKVADRLADPVPSFAAGTCVAPFAIGPLTINLSDTDGHTSQVTIDPSGLARRQN